MKKGAPPNIYDDKYVKWSLADLPILPQKWQYLVSTSTKKQFGILQKLMHRPDVESIVNSCDSGRGRGRTDLPLPGLYQQAGCKNSAGNPDLVGINAPFWRTKSAGKAVQHGGKRHPGTMGQ